MKILVTGGAGFIGSHLIDKLLKSDNKVVCIDNLSLGNLENLKFAKKNSSFVFIKENLNDVEELSKTFEKFNFDFVYHMAANSDISKGSSQTKIDLKNTFLTTFNVLDQMKKFGVKNIFFPSSSAVYGSCKNKIFEETTKEPLSFYGSAKLSSEAYLSAFSYLNDINVWILRLANVIGPRITHGIIFDFVNKLKKDKKKLMVLGDGNQEKPYLHVEDLIDCIFFIIKNSNNRFNEFNVSSKDCMKVKKIAEETVKYFGEKTKITYGKNSFGWKGDVPYYDYDIKKLKDLGWAPKRNSLEALRKTLTQLSSS
jgi:UDP-glucose 4-epimerase|tara:strand:- start:3283 stop:4215 length:933 start_codon:yes stop_codon:yes gene_type:complete